ncbi:MAG: response regulator [Rhodocyclaceae bacterium]|nr:response regulator [Rhodocyclaceae bacterium]
MPARILIAEDHPSSRELLVYLLEAAGYVVHSVDDGAAALQAIREIKPNLVICDLQMPELDGYGVLRALRADPDFASLPVLAVTAFSMLGDRETVMSAGFTAYFSKPIDPETFVDEMASHLPAHLLGTRPNSQ